MHDLINLSSGNEMSINDACEVLSQVGLCAKEYINREIDNSLSGGELKRIEIATISVRNSKVTIFDEPEAGIDLWSFNSLINIFKNLREKNNSKTIIISHQERIINIADKLVLLDNGKVNEIESSDYLKQIVSIPNCPKVGGDSNE